MVNELFWSILQAFFFFLIKCMLRNVIIFKNILEHYFELKDKMANCWFFNVSNGDGSLVEYFMFEI